MPPSLRLNQIVAVRLGDKFLRFEDLSYLSEHAGKSEEYDLRGGKSLRRFQGYRLNDH